MKQCPKCNRKYSQELIYCLEDGAVLINEFDSDATIVSPGGGKSFSSRNLNINHFHKWTRNEKLTFFGVIFAFVALLATLMAWRMPQQPYSYEECVLFNNVPNEKSVRARRDCDGKKPCEDDPATTLGSYPNDTKVRKIKETPVAKGDKFNWVQVEVIDTGLIIWVAHNKLKCK